MNLLRKRSADVGDSDAPTDLPQEQQPTAAETAVIIVVEGPAAAEAGGGAEPTTPLDVPPSRE